MCFLDATSGTTPPNFLCNSICVETTFASTSLPFFNTATAVSSQLLSIDKVIISPPHILAICNFAFLRLLIFYLYHPLCKCHIYNSDSWFHIIIASSLSL